MQRELFSRRRGPVTEPVDVTRWDAADSRAPCPDCGKRLVCAQCRADIRRVAADVAAARQVA